MLVVQRMQLGRAAGKGGGFVRKQRVFLKEKKKKKKHENVKSCSPRREQTHREMRPEGGEGESPWDSKVSSRPQ